LHGTLEIERDLPPVPLLAGGGKTPPPDPPSTVIDFKPLEWKLLKSMREYVKSSPDDYMSKAVYRNSLRIYGTSN
jgi:hypothetical protein